MLDLAITTFFANSPTDMLVILCAIPVIIVIFVSIIKPFDV